ncbi:MAG: hypothetical protein ACREO5_08140, partial [Candidatus Binatia bacterium]
LRTVISRDTSVRQFATCRWHSNCAMKCLLRDQISETLIYYRMGLANKNKEEQIMGGNIFYIIGLFILGYLGLR